MFRKFQVMLALLAALSAAPAYAGEAGEQCNSTHALKQADAKMHSAMDIVYTGEADVDFVRGMIPHHQGAVDMAEAELKFGKDKTLRSLAENIINAQKHEIFVMKRWMERYDHGTPPYTYDSVKKMGSVQGFMAAHHKMHADMQFTYTGDADIDFAQGMIPHHQGAVDMAKVILKHGENPAIRELASGIINSQNREIALMKSWLADHGHAVQAPSSTPPSHSQHH